eukprot:scaffold44_cov339-Pavlova_lutheri.AAC.33
MHTVPNEEELEGLLTPPDALGTMTGACRIPLHSLWMSKPTGKHCCDDRNPKSSTIIVKSTSLLHRLIFEDRGWRRCKFCKFLHVLCDCTRHRNSRFY